MASNTETRPLLSRLLGRDAAVAQLIVITLLIFVAMTALNPDKFLRYYNFESLTYIAPELGILSVAMMIAMLTGGSTSRSWGWRTSRPSWRGSISASRP